MSQPGPQIRPAVTSDLDAILALERATLTAPHWPPSSYAVPCLPPRPNDTRRCLFVAILDGKLQGFAVGVMSEPQSAAELESVVVAESARRYGIGRALCLAVLDWSRHHGASEILLEVRAHSEGPIALYRSIGFASTGIRPDYYADPKDDALLMRLSLKSQGE